MKFKSSKLPFTRGHAST